MTIVIGDKEKLIEECIRAIENKLSEEVKRLLRIYDKIKEHEAEEFWASFDRHSYEEWKKRKKELYSLLRRQERKIVKYMKENGVEVVITPEIEIDIRYPPWNYHL